MFLSHFEAFPLSPTPSPAVRKFAVNDRLAYQRLPCVKGGFPRQRGNLPSSEEALRVAPISVLNDHLSYQADIDNPLTKSYNGLTVSDL